MTPGGTLRTPHILPRLGACTEEPGARIRVQFDLRADEQNEQAKKPDTEESEQGDDRKGKKRGKQPADGRYNKYNEPAGHQPLTWWDILSWSASFQA